MKAFVIAVVALALLAGPVLAGQCPTLHKQLNDAVGKMKMDDPKAAEARGLIKASQLLHEWGSHADSIKIADEAAKFLKIELKKKM